MRESIIVRRGGGESALGCCCRIGDTALSANGVQLGPERNRAAGTVEARFREYTADQDRIGAVRVMKSGGAG